MPAGIHGAVERPPGMNAWHAKLVIFDCDGVLVDSEPIAAAVLAEELTRIGFATTAAECIARYTGLSIDSMVETIEAQWGRHLPGNFRDRLRDADYAAFRTRLQPIPGVKALLQKLTTARCVASSGSMEKLSVTLSATGLLAQFAPHIFSAEQVAHGKPAPDLFLHAASCMGISPQDCVVIEDSIAGIQGACAANMRVIGFAGGGHADSAYASSLSRAGAAVVVKHMNELSSVLD